MPKMYDQTGALIIEGFLSAVISVLGNDHDHGKLRHVEYRLQECFREAQSSTRSEEFPIALLSKRKHPSPTGVSWLGL